MPTYFRLDCKLNRQCGRVRPKANVGEVLLDATFVEEDDLTLPWPFSLTVPAEGKLLMSAYYSGYNLMSRALVKTIQESGVDNLQVFPATITDDKTGAVNEDYAVVNVIGLVEAADLTKSKTLPLADAKFFQHLAVDSKRAKGLLMFRLAESYTDIIIAESVAKAIHAGEFQDVILQPLD